MKKTILFIAMALLCLKIELKAQNGVLNIGDKVPENFWQQANLTYQNGKVQLKNLDSYKKKLLILDFWATWCAPCLEMFPKTEKLSQQFAGKLNFLPISYQPQNEVEPFLERYQKQTGLSITTLVADQWLAKLFPHKSLPHYVWINAAGSIIAISSFEEITATNIQKVLDEKPITINTKKDETPIFYQQEKPLFIAGNGGEGNNLLYHSIFTTYTAGLTAGYEFDRLDTTGLSPRKVTARNLNLNWLYRLAYGEGIKSFAVNRLVLEVAMPEKLINYESGQAYANWKKQNTYCYELIVPPAKAKVLFKLMQHDLSILFSEYEVKIERRKVQCLALVRTSTLDKIHTNGGTASVTIDAYRCLLHNTFLSHFVNRLDKTFMQNSKLPIVDETGYKGRIDLQINTSLANVDSLNKELEKYDLKFVTQEQEIEMLVIKDHQP